MSCQVFLGRMAPSRRTSVALTHRARSRRTSEGRPFEPVASGGSFLGGVARVVLARQLQDVHAFALRADDDGRAILTDGGILLVGHPGPHDLAGIRVAVHDGRVRGVGECVGDAGFADRGLGPIRGRRVLVVVVGAGIRGRGRG